MGLGRIRKKSFPEWDHREAPMLIHLMRTRYSYSWSTIGSFWYRTAEEAEAVFNALKDQDEQWWADATNYSRYGDRVIKECQLSRVNGGKFARSEPNIGIRMINTAFTLVNGKPAPEPLPSAKDTPVVSTPPPPTSPPTSSPSSQPVTPAPKALKKKKKENNGRGKKPRASVTISDTATRLATLVDDPLLPLHSRGSVSDLRTTRYKREQRSSKPRNAPPIAPPQQILRPVRSLNNIKPPPPEPVWSETTATPVPLLPEGPELAPPVTVDPKSKIWERRIQSTPMVKMDPDVVKRTPGEAYGSTDFRNLPWPRKRGGIRPDQFYRGKTPSAQQFYELAQGGGEAVEEGLGVVRTVRGDKKKKK